MAPVTLALQVLGRIAVDLGGRRDQDASPGGLSTTTYTRSPIVPANGIATFYHVVRANIGNCKSAFTAGDGRWPVAPPTRRPSRRLGSHHGLRENRARLP